ncbi:hypothetical protein JW930_05095 [Candidatus Woesearchaeota archaeon]|nr:hypothetical protein [Candidatus Woesearchaeota archaeon]
MRWKTVVNSDDLIIIEKQLKGEKRKIEARLENNLWSVYETSIKKDNADLVREFSVNSKTDVLNLIEQLKKAPDSKGYVSRPIINVELRRIFKEEGVEKWFFNVAHLDNYVFVKYDEPVDVDIILHHKLQKYENQIVIQLEEKLGLREFAEEIYYNTYYYNSSKQTKKLVSDHMLGRIYMEFGFEDE